MLNRNEFRSIWDLAYRWEGLEPPEKQPSELPDGVVDKIDKLIWGVRRERIPLRHPSSLLVNPTRSNWIDLVIFDRKFLRLVFYHIRKKFPREFLDRLYIMRPDLLEWCDLERKEPPGFWMPAERQALLSGPVPASGKVPIGRHLPEDIDRNRCQAIALTLWDIDPNIHPAHMVRCKYVRSFGNGAQYKDENTLKRWIAEVDPKRGERKPGPPPRISYLIDLEKGGLASISDE